MILWRFWPCHHNWCTIDEIIITRNSDTLTDGAILGIKFKQRCKKCGYNRTINKE